MHFIICPMKRFCPNFDCSLQCNGERYNLIKIHDPYRESRMRGGGYFVLDGIEGWVVNFISAPPDSSQNIFRSACFSILLRKQIHVQLQRHLLQNELSRSVSRAVPACRHRHACAPHRCHSACAPRHCRRLTTDY